ncbi:MAG: hypothetical protein DUD32_12610 [Lactobacillus sp.]|nr:MAG: hypothetical protein DUD32_12610 [Lactobacillus sp.]
MEIRPTYYKDENGHDLFWKMEHGMYDLAWSIGFCHINAEKYERRMGRKTAIETHDKQKAATYRAEEERLKQLHREGVI